MNKISSRQLFVFAFFLSCFLFPGFGDTFILSLGKNFSIIGSIIGLIIGLVPVLLIIYISKFTIDKNIFQVNIEKFKKFGYVLNVLLILSAIYIIMVGSWSIVNFTISQFLTRTSYYLITLFLFSLIAYMITKNMEVAGRTFLIMFAGFVLTSAFNLIFLVSEVEISNLYPIIDTSKKNIFESIMIFQTFSSFPLISLLFIKRNDVTPEKKFNRSIIFGYFAAAVVTIGYLFLILSSYGIDMAILFTYPEYTLLKRIQAFDFIERIENIVSSIIFIASFCGITSLFMFIKESIRNKIKKNNKLNIVMIIICLLIPLITVYLLKNFRIYSLYTHYSMISFGILFVIILNAFLLFITKKRS